MSERFTIFRSTYEALKAMPPEILKEIFILYGEYALNDTLPETQDGIAYGVFCSMKPLIDASKKKQAAGKTGGEVSKAEANGSNPEPKIKDKSIKEKEERINNKKHIERFTPPDVEQVREYIREKGYNVDAEAFVDFYSSKGWLVGKSPMKDWKAAVRNWSRSQRPETTAKDRQEKTATRFNNFPQRQYDYDDLERKLWEKQGKLLSQGAL